MGTEITVKTAKEQPLFLKKKHELESLVRELRKNNKEAIKLLVDTMKDEKVDLKLRVDIAKELIVAEVKIQDQINKDTLNRQIAEIKANGPTKKLILEDGEDEDSPSAIDFTEVREV